EWGIDGDGVFKSVFSPENDFDVQYLFFNGFDSFDELRIFIDDIEVDYVSARGASPFLTFKIPESLASGNYTYRMTYQGNDIIYRKLFLPEGRLKLATTHPQNNEFPVAHYVFQNKLCFILFVHGDNNNKLEYASWDPSTSVWE